MSELQLEKPGRDRKNTVIGAAIVVVLVLLGLGVWILLGGKSHQAPKQPKITLVAQAPPPPPPPPKFEKKPDPPKEQKEIKVEQPQPKQAPPQPTPDLKMEGAAGDGPSAFGAGKITSDDLSKIGTGNGEKGGLLNPFNNYANLLKGDLQRYLRKNNMLRRHHYTVEVHVWVARDGELKKFEIIGSTGDSDTDDAIHQAMSSLSGFNQAPPTNMPQPIRLRIATAG